MQPIIRVGLIAAAVVPHVPRVLGKLGIKLQLPSRLVWKDTEGNGVSEKIEEFESRLDVLENGNGESK